MARCPLCAERSAKRFCPAKQVMICAVCCGTKREVEIDCPSACPHLKTGRSYESEKRTPAPDLAARVQAFDNNFVFRYSPILDEISRAIIEERRDSQWLVDADVFEVFSALVATLKTLSSGIHYETLPDGSVRLSLFRRLKALLDGLMEEQPDSQHSPLRVSEAMQVLEFLTLAGMLKSNARPRSRQYLDWLNTRGGEEPDQSGRLILP